MSSSRPSLHAKDSDRGDLYRASLDAKTIAGRAPLEPPSRPSKSRSAAAITAIAKICPNVGASSFEVRPVHAEDLAAKTGDLPPTRFSVHGCRVEQWFDGVRSRLARI